MEAPPKSNGERDILISFSMPVYPGAHNPHRIQRRLGWCSPDEYEADYYRNLKAAMTAETK